MKKKGHNQDIFQASYKCLKQSRQNLLIPESRAIYLYVTIQQKEVIEVLF